MLADARPAPTTVAIIGSAGRRGDAARLTDQHFTAMLRIAQGVVRQVLGVSPSQVHLVSGGSSYADHVAVVLYVQSVMEQQQDERHSAYSALTLHLPTPFHASPTSSGSTTTQSSSPTRLLLHACGCAASVSYAHPHFHDNGSAGWRTNPGRVLNYYHQHFSRAIGRSSFHDLCTAVALGAELRVVNECRAAGDAFHKRNGVVAAQSQRMIAFTFGGALLSSPDSPSRALSLSALLASPSNQPCPGGTADTWSKCCGNRVHVPQHLFDPQLTHSLQWFDTADEAGNECTTAARSLTLPRPPSLPLLPPFSPIPRSTHATILPPRSGSAQAQLTDQQQRRQQLQQQRGAKRRRAIEAVQQYAVLTSASKKTLLTSWLHCTRDR